jgi:predicted regulator of Ras-like GTPase activity (Roadblock/LC7/MglB family)
MTSGEAEHWRETTERVGRELLPSLERLAASLPSVTSVMVSTADGFNLCSMGLDERAVDRVSAMGSALHSVARSAVESLGRGEGLSDGEPPESLTIAHNGNITVVLTVPAGDHEHALLWVTGSDESLGAILFRAKAAVPDLSARLGWLND